MFAFRSIERFVVSPTANPFHASHSYRNRCFVETSPRNRGTVHDPVSLRIELEMPTITFIDPFLESRTLEIRFTCPSVTISSFRLQSAVKSLTCHRPRCFPLYAAALVLNNRGFISIKGTRLTKRIHQRGEFKIMVFFLRSVNNY